MSPAGLVASPPPAFLRNTHLAAPKKGPQILAVGRSLDVKNVILTLICIKAWNFDQCDYLALAPDNWARI